MIWFFSLNSKKTGTLALYGDLVTVNQNFEILITLFSKIYLNMTDIFFLRLSMFWRTVWSLKIERKRILNFDKISRSIAMHVSDQYIMCYNGFKIHLKFFFIATIVTHHDQGNDRNLKDKNMIVLIWQHGNFSQKPEWYFWYYICGIGWGGRVK